MSIKTNQLYDFRITILRFRIIESVFGTNDITCIKTSMPRLYVQYYWLYTQRRCPTDKMKRPRQLAVRQNARPLALFSFVINVTASFFRQFPRYISTWEKELNIRRQTLKPLENKTFSVCHYYTVMASSRIPITMTSICSSRRTSWYTMRSRSPAPRSLTFRKPDRFVVPFFPRSFP